MMKRTERRKMKKTKRKRFTFSIFFFISIFMFMIVFRHEDELTNEQRRAIESVTFTEEWTVHGHLPHDLVKNTVTLPATMKSRIIHRIMEEEPIHLLHLPSEQLASQSGTQAYGMPVGKNVLTSIYGDTNMGQLPHWYVKLASQLNEKYQEQDLIKLSLIPPSEVDRQVTETVKAEIEKTRSEEAERHQQIIAAHDAGESPSYFEEIKREDEEMISVYRDITKQIRSLKPDVILLDFELIVDHMQHEDFRISNSTDISLDETIDQTYEFLESLYRPIDRFTTYLLFSEDVYEKLGFEPTAQLEDSLALLAEQNDYLHFVHVSSYEDNESWMEEDILPLLYSE